MKWKIIVLVSIICVLVTGFLGYRIYQYTTNDRLAWIDRHTRNELSTIADTVFQQIQNIEKSQALYAPYIAQLSLQKMPSGFFQVGQINCQASELCQGLDSVYLNSILETMPIQSQNKYSVLPFLDRSQSAFILITMQKSADEFVGYIATANLFKATIDAHAGSDFNYVFINTNGYVGAHETSEYIGSAVKGDPLYQWLSQNEATRGAEIMFDKKSNRIWVTYEQVPHSNLFVSSQIRMDLLQKQGQKFLLQTIFLGVGILLLSIVAGLLLTGTWEDRFDSLKLENNQLKKQIADRPMVPMQVSTEVKNPEQLEQKLSQAKMNAYTHVASALAHEVRGPLTAVLGYAQLLTEQQKNPEFQNYVDSILRETRSLRDVMNKIQVFSGDSDTELRDTKIEAPLLNAIKNCQNLFDEKHVELEKSLSDTAILHLSIDHLTKAFENIFYNAVEAMERQSQKKIKIELSENEQEVIVQIQDKGEGIAPEKLERIFDPFYTTRSFQNHTGLGLSMALGVFKEHHAHVDVQSQLGQGTTVSIHFKKALIQPKEQVTQLKAPSAPPSKVKKPPVFVESISTSTVTDAKGKDSEIMSPTGPAEKLPPLPPRQKTPPAHPMANAKNAHQSEVKNPVQTVSADLKSGDQVNQQQVKTTKKVQTVQNLDPDELVFLDDEDQSSQSHEDNEIHPTEMNIDDLLEMPEGFQMPDQQSKSIIVENMSANENQQLEINAEPILILPPSLNKLERRTDRLAQFDVEIRQPEKRS